MVKENDMTLDSELERLGEQMAGRRTSGAQVTATPAVSQPTGLTETDAMIEVEGVSKAFGSVQALVDVSLRVPAGRVVGLLGPNGAGKTTLVRILTTLLQPDAGHARVAGLDVVRDAVALRSAIGLAGQYAAVDEMLTGRENLELIGQLYHLRRAELRQRAERVLEQFELAGAADRPVRTYSGGMRRRLDLAASLVGRPPVLILDEPTTGLDPRSRVDLWQHIEDLVAGGTTILLTTQYLEEADRLAHWIVVIDTGRVIAQGTPGQLKDQIGGAVIDLQVTDPAQLEVATAVLAGLGDGQPQTDPVQRRATVPAKGGAETLVAVARGIDDAGIELDDLGLRRPSLDDVFMALTGQRPDGPAAPAAVPDRQVPGRKEAGTTATAAAPAPPRDAGGPRMTPALALGDIAAVTRRNLLHTLRSPQLLAFASLQPVVFVLLFRYVFGGAISVPGGSYIDYLLPGIFVQTTLFGGSATAVGLAQDLREGIIDRFRSLPMARSAVLAGRTLADLARNVVTVALMVAVGTAVGFRFHAGPAAAVAALVWVLAFGYAFSWVFATIGLVTRNPEAAQFAAGFPLFLLVFASSAFVPVRTMPDWLQAFASVQPVSVTVNAVRALSEGGPTLQWFWQSLAWTAGILLVFVPLSVRQYRRL
jgi:ABC transporter DrrB family efflux protein